MVQIHSWSFVTTTLRHFISSVEGSHDDGGQSGEARTINYRVSAFLFFYVLSTVGHVRMRERGVPVVDLRVSFFRSRM